MFPLTFLASLLPFFNIVIGNELRLTTASEFYTFANKINSGTNYSGTTVYLDSDLSLPNFYSPLGTSDSSQFLGTFDGQGYTISNFVIHPSLPYVGLFGYSTGMTIRNLVLDSSCLIYNTFCGYDVYTGGIIGYYAIKTEGRKVENIVNMADVIYTGIASDYSLHFGGIVGYFSPSTNVYVYSHVKNCVNYGDITNSGTTKNSFIGGIIGRFIGCYYINSYIQNCLNYGTITRSGTSSSNIGGIVGYCSAVYINNCVNAGGIVNSTSYSAGGIVGYGTHSYITNCYFTSTLSNYDIHARTYYVPTVIESSIYNNVTFELNNRISTVNYTGNSLIDALNAYAEYYILNDYSHWILNKNNKNISFTINNRDKPIKMNSQLILFPNLASEGNTSFDGWYDDKEYTSPFTIFEVTSNTDLYGKFEVNTNNYTITFDSRRNGVSIDPLSAQYNTIVSLPNNSIRDNCNVAWWETDKGCVVESVFSMPAFNFTLYAVWKCTRIKLSEDFLDFIRIINTGTDKFSETTVFLDSDLSLPEVTEPIGNSTYFFQGTFDGQGYIISDLNITSPSRHVGLFGYSRGLIIRNVVLEDSCSITNSYSDITHTYIGGIIGECSHTSSNCNIENIVNKASITFRGNITGNTLYLGGVIGIIPSTSQSYNIFLKNCANYGVITHSGISGSSYIGGIVGYLDHDKFKYIYNCLNYGTIIHNGTTSGTLYIGGITGKGYYAYIENCVSGSRIALSGTYPTTSYIGNIVGCAGQYTYINYCFFTNELGDYNVLGDEYPPTSTSNIVSYDNTTFELNESVSVGDYKGSSLIKVLNAAADYYILCDYSHWALNKNNKNISFTINNRDKPIKMNSQLILLPNLASEDNVSFDGWYDDNEYSSPFTAYEATSDTDLYGKFGVNTNNYTITFVSRKEGVFIDSISAQFNSNVSLPSDLIRDDCMVGYWETEYEDNVGFNFIMLAHNITLYAVWKCTHIRSILDFIVFTKIVNTGVDRFSGTTIYLDSDLSLSEITEPIGKDSFSYFNGTFDGQGHVISDFKINSFSQYTGLFGYSIKITIRNVVLDASCSIKNSNYYTGDTYVGGFLGYCYTTYGSKGGCFIKNSVNMADVSFNGNISYSLYLGGIVGYIYNNNYYSYSSSCANYGSVTDYGASKYTYIGGIVGYSYGYSYYSYFYNCLNYGTITYSGMTSKYPYIGGIAGYTYCTYVGNCVSSGKIISSKNYFGNIVGSVNYKSFINYCYFTSDTKITWLYGSGTPSNNEGTLNYPVNINSTLIDNLYNQSTFYNWNKWLLNPNNDIVTFKINNNKGFSLSSQAIIFPSPNTIGSLVFSGWFIDPYYKDEFKLNETSKDTLLYGLYGNIITIYFNEKEGNVNVTSKLVSVNNPYGTLPIPSTREGYTFDGWFTEKNESITNDTLVIISYDHTLYSHWITNSYTITFIFDNGNDPERRIIDFNSTVIYPEDPIKEGYIFYEWDINTTEMPARDINITALWIADNYTVTLNTNGGEELIEDEIEVTFNSTYGDLPEVERVGYTFNGWVNENNESVTNESIVSIANDHVIYAQWIADNYTVTLNSNGGEELIENEIEVTFNSTYGDFPEVERIGYIFNGWANENNESITNETIVNTASNHILYAQWIANNYTVTLNTNGGEELIEDEIEVIFNSMYGDLPEVERIGYTFNGWTNENNESITNETIVNTTSNHILYAQWTINKYVITFIFDNGNDPEIKTFEYNSTIVYLNEPVKEGYMFNGWDKSDVEFMPAENLTVTALWTKITTLVEINFDSKSITEEEIKTIVEQYTTEKFTIVKIENTPDGIKVIIKFVSKEVAEDFVKSVSTPNRATKKDIIRAGFSSETFDSLSVLAYPLVIFSILF